MAIIYWVEDEIDRLQGTLALLEQDGNNEVRVLRTASELGPSLESIKTHNAPILFDLWIPPGDVLLSADDSRGTQDRRGGPETGMILLKEIRTRLGSDWPIWIISGNLTRGFIKRLVAEVGIPFERIYHKPLNDRNDSLVESVLSALKSSARPALVARPASSRDLHEEET
jgi:hypothetical protein